MADGTRIEWSDATWNPITGCSVHSAGCTNCYAMKLAGGRMKHHPSRAGLTMETKAGPVWNGEVRFNEEWLRQPLQWTKPRMIFVCAHADLFHESVPDEWIDRIFAVMALCPQHRFQVLTKRSARMREYLASCALFDGAYGERTREMAIHLAIREMLGPDEAFDCSPMGGCQPGMPMPNVWLGVSVEDQRAADERIPDLLATPAAVRWLSCEPLLGPVDLETAWHGESALRAECWGDCAWCVKGHPPLHNCQRGRQSEEHWQKGRDGIDWVVAGGESGPSARPMHPDWARSLRDQCAEAGVPFLFKQWGEWAPGEVANWPQTRTETGAHWFDGEWSFERITPRVSEELHTDDAPDVWRFGKKKTGRLLDGVLHDGYPAVGA